MEIRTARLVLRRAVPADLAAFHPILSSPEAMRYWATLPHASLEVTEKWFADQFFSGLANRDEWVIERDGRVIGNIGIWKLPEFGFILHPDAWGQGIGTEAARAFLDYAFATHPVDAIKADVDPRNSASLNLLQKLGFTVTGTAENTFLLGDEWCHSVYLALPRPS
ncbi:MAG TPA: GNAT family N-acetyltransferase [Devosia sp.]|jgi:RimJ/RimL family protein N-acetyltransferase|uniref:GNAT family N-acetyltransferase n=1 Tax=Devosia sp. TaxID=1871048 RepID=UPI002DDDBAE7|nr:GNAT family N-acetyltransferase [Devosia sp.]HEV2516530.1 GNAT family N-acetyltransferase [Devosia sp.]